jgi:hypothetical protein
MSRAFVIFGRVVAIAYIIVGIAGGIWPGHWDDAAASDQIVWIVLLLSGGVLILAGLRLFARSPWGGAALVSIGAILGALAIFWTIVALVVAVVLIVWSVIAARRMAGATPAAD